MMGFPKQATVLEKYGPAMEIMDQSAADIYFAKLVEHSMVWFRMKRDEAERLERTNLGYFAGYYDHETRARVETLFSCQHPVFGSIEQNGPPTASQAFEAGTNLAKRVRSGN